MTQATTRTALVVSAHPGDFVWRAGGAIALHAQRGTRVKIVCLSYGARGESQGAWKKPGATLATVKQQRHAEAVQAATTLGAEFECFDLEDYPLDLNRAALERLVDIYRALQPDFVLTHAAADPYNYDHPDAARFAQQARIIAQAAGHKPGEKTLGAPPVFLFEPHQPEQCGFQPNVILNIDPVWEVKRKAFEALPAQTHLWDYYTRVALQRGAQGGRNAGRSATYGTAQGMTYGEAYQRVFPMVLEELA